MRERGQISVAAVAAITVVLLGGVLIGYLSMLAAGGGHAQRAADLAAIAAAGRLGRRSRCVERRPAPRRRSRRPPRTAAGSSRCAWCATGSVPRAVDVAVSVAVDGSVPVAGRQHRRVVARARAGVAFSATLPAGRFRPIDLHGARGPLAAVAAAEAQVGWPYRWGGESREEGGFDCSGLVDYAYAAAGDPLPGRPTAADLWQMARPEPAAELAPADLVFVGAPAARPTTSACTSATGWWWSRRTPGASVRYEPLAAGGWDGFARHARCRARPADRRMRRSRPRRAPTRCRRTRSRRSCSSGLAADPGAAATALAAAMRRHPGDLAAALADALGDPSAAALVLRSASGPGLGDGFGAAVRLLPTPRLRRDRLPPGARARSGGGRA